MSKKKIKTIFIGTPDFGIPSLQSLIESEEFDVVATITQIDKKVGRKQQITPPPIKDLSIKNNIPVFQPSNIKNFSKEIEQLKPDLIVVIAYAQIITKEILNIPKYGCVNVHGSLLPKYRGASCIQASLLNNDDETGITIMKMNEGLDTGPIIYQTKINIAEDDTADTLSKKLSILSAKFLASTLQKYIENKIQAKEQDNSKASYVGLLKKSDGEINWNQDAQKVFSHFKAMSPWPGAFTRVNINKTSKLLKIIAMGKIIKTNSYKLGELFTNDKKLAVQCRKNAIIINFLQLEGKKPLSSEDFLRGNDNFIGKILEK